MGHKQKHMGATTEQWRYRHKVRCLYSGNEGKVFTVQRTIDERDQQRLNFKFMKERCMCSSCIEKRENRNKLVKALEGIKAYHELELLGEYNG